MPKFKLIKPRSNYFTDGKNKYFLEKEGMRYRVRSLIKFLNDVKNYTGKATCKLDISNIAGYLGGCHGKEADAKDELGVYYN